MLTYFMNEAVLLLLGVGGPLCTLNLIACGVTLGDRCLNPILIKTSFPFDAPPLSFPLLSAAYCRAFLSLDSPTKNNYCMFSTLNCITRPSL